jgi:autoinducer 2-degrading protein
MFIVQVYVKVREKYISSFILETKENASKSINEKGVLRFEVQQNLDDPKQFLLTEIYTDTDAPLEHKKTDHYGKWKEAVEHMMEEPRYSVKYTNIFPEDLI